MSEYHVYKVINLTLSHSTNV